MCKWAGRVNLPRVRFEAFAITCFMPLILKYDLIRGCEWGGPFVGCRLKFSYFVGSRLNFLIFVSC